MDKIADNLLELEFANQYPDFYKVLGVRRGTDLASIKKTYFKLARQLHPDMIPKETSDFEKKQLSRKFQKVAEAWDVLGDDEKR